MFILELWNEESKSWQRVKTGTKRELDKIANGNTCSLIQFRVRRMK